VTNGLDETGRVAAYAVPLGTIEPESAQFLNDWPKNIYSLSHVSLPFPPDDPLYGGPDSVSEGKLHLGNLALRGEHKVLHVAAADIMRLRWNPFFDYVEQRVLGFIATAGGEAGQTRAAD
jgi:hypothetical protein